ncbi:beta-1,6-N-acetylglucosaminyltransferase, contains WSC domain [Phaffia rhodozyma]|uniref:Beta-1,6-N-acetylglucosaminyltransferase, contains WSC domain n=1 Tax=Phaffia rhodozyma TaxID=264483 RepID=A0A0F7SN53_PHARH|nr:beta-1,6-N-acetylglucosaminyltransferase, contains WSC domain [Phaffia rhodozyma]
MFFIKHRLAVLATSMLLAPMASAHISFWHPAMYGFCDGGNGKSDYCINTSNPVTPLAQLSFGGTKGQGWWYHGNLDQPPADGEFIELPVGGSITMELACNKAQTQWQPNDGVTIPLLACDSPAVLHNADAILSPTGPPTYHTRGCALAIAYESDQYKTQPEDFVIISTNRTCPFWHFTDFQIPSDLPACPEGGCNAFWLWIHEAGDYGGQSYQMYLSPFRAKVTGATNTAPLPSPRVSRKCVGAPEYCVKGPKQPHYWSQLERNNIYQNSNDPPYYNEDYGMMDGAQTDLYADVSNNTDAGTTVGYENIGCWSDNPDPDRVLDGMEYVVLNNMTPELCTLRCSGANYTYAGTQNGDTCYCGNSLEGSNSLSDSSCQTPCTGNSSETCGGGYANGIWALTANLPESQTVWEPLGCFGDPSGRLMGTPVAQTSTMSYAACRRQCAFDGYDIAGLENGYICLCANSIPASSVVDDSLCNVPCQGNSSEACGSYYSLSAFSLKHGLTATVSAASNSWSSVGCMTDSSTRTLEGSTITNNMMTNAACIEACDSTGYTYAGTEAGYQCFCSNEIAATGLVAASSDCYQPCWGNSTDKCGGDYRVSVFSKAAEIPVDSTIVSNFTSLGCWSEGSGTNRILDGEVFSSGTMTPDQCISKCGTDGYVYAALNGGYTCQCGNTIYSTSELQLDSVCTTACGGDSTKICGGTNSASLYGSGSKIGSTSSFTNVGCWVSNGNGTTTLSGSSSSSSTMTPGLCQARCAIDGYSFAGVQENECYCGNSMGVSSLIKSDFCNTPCSGNGTDFCGGYYAMSLFQSTTATAAALPAAPGWTALGCRSDSSDRTLLDSTQVLDIDLPGFIVLL